MLSFKFQSHSCKFEDFKINPHNPFTHISTKEWVNILYLLLGISYNIQRNLSFTFLSQSIKIEDFQIINPIISFNPISTKRGSENVEPITNMSYNMSKMLGSKFQRHSIKIEDLKNNHINPFNPISTKGQNRFFKHITRIVLKYVQGLRFKVLI